MRTACPADAAWMLHVSGGGRMRTACTPDAAWMLYVLCGGERGRNAYRLHDQRCVDVAGVVCVWGGERGRNAYRLHAQHGRPRLRALWRSWAKAHDDEARQIAAAAQRFALRYLDKRARTCYWYKLLTEFAKLLNYDIDPALEVWAGV
eukprot:366024-Chlamydomonas_euryale.AAC.22